jgi:hypothetical protein
LDYVTLVAGLLLPWIAGSAVIVAWSCRQGRLDRPGEFAWIAGTGFLVGSLLLTVVMRAMSVAGIRFGAQAIALPLLTIAVVAGFHTWRRDGKAAVSGSRSALRALVDPPELHGTARLAWWALLALIATRLALLSLEVAWQPLYPWDAWTRWATKARVWYELGHIAAFVYRDTWFAAGGASYFDAAPGTPPTVPLLQVWACIALGRWDDALMNWPWWQLAVALALATYGALRALGTSALLALVGTYFVSSLPFGNIHVALAGYADLPLAAFYTGAALALLRWADSRDAGDLALAVALAVASTQITTPGFAWALTLVPGVVVATMPRNGARIFVAGWAASLFALAVLAQTNIPVFGHVVHLDYAPDWDAFFDSHFVQGDWNLLWYAVPIAAILAGRQLAAPALAPMTAIAASGATLVLVGLAFPTAPAWMGGATPLNRATLHFAPFATAFAVLAFRAFAERWQAAAADPQHT